MPKLKYVSKKFRSDSLVRIDKANEIIDEYMNAGYQLTLRQLYYQFVSRDLIANSQKEYKRLGSLINDARLAGRIDWHAIEDRTRNLQSLAHWDSPSEIVDAIADQYRTDRWQNQQFYVEVWIEKEALAGVFERVCSELDVPFFSCRGYTSQSEMWSAAQRLRKRSRSGKEIVILHFGDHDPSGIDMTRDIRERLQMFGCMLDLQRLALNMDQVDEYEPPPNPAKTTDSRFAGYIAEYGDESWELDALEPSVLADLVRDQVNELLDHLQWGFDTEYMEEERAVLTQVSQRWDDVTQYLAG
jgi:hypothetical protein